MKARCWSALLVLAVMLGVTGCAPYARVARVQPSSADPRASRIESAVHQAKREPMRALAGFLAAAREAQQRLARDPADCEACADYNFAVARVIGTIQDARLAPWRRPLRVSAAAGEYILSCKTGTDPERNPALYDLTPADELRISGPYVRDRLCKNGIGAPVVALERRTRAPSPQDRMVPRLCYGLTAVIRFEGRRAVLAFEDPLAAEHVPLAGHRFPLAADFTAPIGVLLAQENTRQIELDALFRSEKYAGAARILRTQPYDPRKTVVLLIHGLKDTPATWVPMYSRLIADPQIRRRYQFWCYSYPTGYPYPYSAALLRRELDASAGRFPLRREVVVIGHSMGGCISRLLITDTGDELWRALFQTAPADTAIPPDSKALLRETLIFRHRPEVGRVIFIAAPLRGSDLARNWVGRTGSMLVKVPRGLLRVGADALRVVSFQRGTLRMKRAPNSVDTLAPNDRVTLALANIPLTSGIPHHVICGDRGRGGYPDKTKPMMSDGVVPYWSSHLESAETERIVPSRHGVHQNPEAIAEVARILHLHGFR